MIRIRSRMATESEETVITVAVVILELGSDS